MTFGKLKNLRVLSVSDAGFFGQIPIEISRLTRLVTPDLSNNYWWKLDFSNCYRLELRNPNFTVLIRNLNELRELYLDDVLIFAKGNDWYLALSSSLPNLRALSLSNCNLFGPINPTLAKLQHLSIICLRQNNIFGEFPKVLSTLSNLTYLDLSYSNLSGTFPKSIFKISTLEIIDLSSNTLLEGSLPEFPIKWSLQWLLLYEISFSGTIPDSIGNLENLSYIYLSSCKFNGQIPNTIGKLNKLVHLGFSSYGFTGPIPNTIGKLNKLVFLDLLYNRFTSPIPLSLFAIPSIQSIRLSHNQLNGSLDGLSNVSSSIKVIDLSYNELAGPFPSSFSKIQGLELLDLSFNNFKGRLQLKEIVKLRNLAELVLSNNYLQVDTEGSISNSIWYLGLASCKLRRFPDFLRNNTMFTLDLSNNGLSGDIPNWIWNSIIYELNLSCNSLVGFKGSMQNDTTIFATHVDLHSNQLQGPIPKIYYVEFLDFSDYNFSSPIQLEISDSSYLSYFSLARNNFYGQIPEILCNYSYLYFLDLSHNRLSGSISHCLKSMKEALQVMNLEGNNINGSIAGFPSRCNLEVLKLGENEIEGPVPSTLENCENLKIFDIGKNKIFDTFPNQLKKISTLRILILRSNQFHGKIGCQTKGIWPNLQIFYISHNNFNGKLPGECILTFKAMMDVEDGASMLNVSGKPYEISITFKGHEWALIKIFAIHTSIDFSSNKFDGKIPSEIGQLKAFFALNLSHNALSGPIPPSIGNLEQVESLDLSTNYLSGTIPSQLALLDSLSFLNLSNNQLVGKIPTGPQFQTFSAWMFEGNEGLCGFPLNDCIVKSEPPSSSPGAFSTSKHQINWLFLFTGLGFIVGEAAAIAAVMIWKKGRKWSDEIVNKLLKGFFQ